MSETIVSRITSGRFLTGKKSPERTPKGGEIVIDSHVVELDGSVAERSARFKQVEHRRELAAFALESARKGSTDADIYAGIARILARGESALADSSDE